MLCCLFYAALLSIAYGLRKFVPFLKREQGGGENPLEWRRNPYCVAESQKERL